MTEYGNIKIKLYDKTPKHKENFTKLVEKGFYDNLLFHQVISDFMIQGGDPDSRGASSDAQLGGGGPCYKIDAEFNDLFFHKKEAICAAGSDVRINPEKKSSCSQFYIVPGKILTNE